MTGSAVIRGPYRYELRRRWAAGPQVAWVMLNPSTADADANDATIRRCVAFSRSWGYGALVVVNLFALRSTDPTALKTAVDPVGPGNDAYILAADDESEVTVAAWGAHGALFGRGREVRLALRDPHVLALTKSGEPRHPLYLPGGLRPARWED